MSRKDAKKLACSRDCSCVKGKERDNNYNECVDKIYDYFDDKLKLYEIHSKLPKKLKKKLYTSLVILTQTVLLQQLFLQRPLKD